MSPDPISVGPLAAPMIYLAEPGADPSDPSIPGGAKSGDSFNAYNNPAIPYGASVPKNINIEQIRKDLVETGVSAPADQVGPLREVVAYAKSQGHDIKFVVVGQQPKFTYYRDVAIDLQSTTGGNVIVLGPDSVGSQGPDFSRVDQEEAAANNLTLTNPPQAARQMVDDLITPGMNWTAITLVLIAVVFVGAVVARVRGKRRNVVAEADVIKADLEADNADTVLDTNADKNAKSEADSTP